MPIASQNLVQCRIQKTGAPKLNPQGSKPNKWQNKMQTHDAPQMHRGNWWCFSLVCHFMKLQSAGGLSKLKIPDPDKPQKWKTITKPHQMDQELLQYCQHHFGKSLGTPFTVSPLNDLLSYDSLTTFGQQVLHDTANLSMLTIDEYTSLLLRHQKYCTPANIPKFQEMPYESLMQGFQKWKERTSTSPSGQHLGIYKALLKDDNHDKRKTHHKPNRIELTTATTTN